MPNPVQQGGIGLGNVNRAFQNKVFDLAGQRDQVGLRPGANAHNLMYVPANVVNGDTITIGDDTYEVDIINTDSSVNTNVALNGTDTISLVTTATAPATAISVGDVIKIESEFLLVLRKVSTTSYVCFRAYAGSAIASHLTNQDVIVSDSVPTGGHISIPLVTTLTPAAFAISFAAVFNYETPAQETTTTRTQTEGEDFTAYSLGTKTAILIVANEPGVNVTATTEDFSASTDNVWANATMVGGLDPAIARSESVSRAVTSAEELDGYMFFAFPFTVRSVTVEMIITATGQRVYFSGEVLIGFAETTTEVLPATIVTIANVGPASTSYIVGFAATNTLTLTAWE